MNTNQEKNEAGLKLVITDFLLYLSQHAWLISLSLPGNGAYYYKINLIRGEY
jgi:hypothetical protein